MYYFVYVIHSTNAEVSKKVSQSLKIIINTDILNILSRKYWNIGLMTITIILFCLTKISGPIADSLYLAGVFQLLRIIYDHSIGFLPFPFIYLLLPLVVFQVFRQFFSQELFKVKVLKILEVFLWLICCFYLLWALNYHATPVEYKADLQMANLSNERLVETFDLVSLELNSLSANVGERNVDAFGSIENTIRPLLEDVLSDFGYPTWGRVRVRKLFAGAILRNRTSGIYIPHVFEGHVDGGLYSIQWPFTIAHEMSHGYGITHESDCNFFAYLACRKSDDPYIRYSATLAYWRYLASHLRSIDQDLYESKRETMDEAVINDLVQIRAHIDRYPDLMPKYRNKIYDQYLKTHGVSAGIKSYDRMILLIEAWNNKKEK